MYYARILCTLAVFGLVCCSGVGEPTPSSPSPTIAAEFVRPPTRCASDGSCPIGYECLTDIDLCAPPCGVNFACPPGWYCSEGGRLPRRDCVPACWFTDMGCP